MVFGEEDIVQGKFLQDTQVRVVERRVEMRCNLLGCLSGNERIDPGALGPLAMRGRGHREEHVGALLGRGRLADHVQAVRNKGVLEFDDLRAQPADLGVGRIGPDGLGRGKVKLGGLRLDQGDQLFALGEGFWGETAPALDRRLQVDQAAIQASVGQGRCQVADERRGCAPLGDRALGGVVRGIQVKAGQIADEAVRPACARQSRLLARHELEGAVGPEMQHRVGPEVLLQVAVERRKRVCRGHAALEEEPHRIALVAEGRLHAHQHVAKAGAQHEQ